ncbi:uncharacterized protein BP5553_01203 [Venustampulla echinocandica]|uniref:Uncharacterized protein n=1 Tax=Venustampulla echinocandica TaxID=2656787 RepID=A0A370U0D6_9HELO|nr:uncharacterized protein BP5553_01203 [Venustampulla echinocandica]RDL41224.1 hypothetical protein BP5553_01203 [Venustampulla echinocandica]
MATSAVPHVVHAAPRMGSAADPRPFAAMVVNPASATVMWLPRHRPDPAPHPLTGPAAAQISSTAPAQPLAPVAHPADGAVIRLPIAHRTAVARASSAPALRLATFPPTDPVAPTARSVLGPRLAIAALRAASAAARPLTVEPVARRASATALPTAVGVEVSLPTATVGARRRRRARVRRLGIVVHRAASAVAQLLTVGRVASPASGPVLRRTMSRRMVPAEPTARPAKARPSGTAVRPVASVAHLLPTAVPGVRQPSALVMLVPEVCRQMARAGRMARLVKDRPLEIAVRPVASVVQLLPTAEQDARQRLARARPTAVAASQLMGTAARTVRHAEGRLSETVAQQMASAASQRIIAVQAAR